MHFYDCKETFNQSKHQETYLKPKYCGIVKGGPLTLGRDLTFLKPSFI